ncbi:stealth family protein [Actinacidiphila glaucinigra]|uniref:Stealth protein CR1, conserved region 1 n=1 Tax=Actinacidiphila glaucinigra TaxID=235986 RepID=A0A238ZH03_9ACTN|nr:stealth family protein [Actinacidiphila glaucinigra]SNR82756.1 Stealth protein CR1, conserved region 1 [Actinacidiphila glaucinigra]
MPAAPAPALAKRLVPARVRDRRAEARALRKEAAAEAKRMARRQAMLAADPAVRPLEVEGITYYGRVVTSFNAAEARARNLHLVTDALQEAGVEYLLIPSRSPMNHVVAVRLHDRKAFLSSMRKLYPDTPLYAAKFNKDMDWPVEAVPYIDGSLPTFLKKQWVLRFGEILLGPGGQILSDLTQGCDVEFWLEGEELLARIADEDLEKAARAKWRLGTLKTQLPESRMPGALIAPRPNAVADAIPADGRVPATRTVAGRSHPTYRDLFRRGVHEVAFPIDVVYTWVDGADPELAAKRELHRPGGNVRTVNALASGASRFASHDELMYSLRSLDMYAPFVRNIHIVTDGQTPSWLDTSAPGVRVVDHKEIFADPSVLPVFNSHAIGTQLHHIDGLSDHYLYFNDDVFLGRPATAEQFFYANGIAKLPFSPFQFGLGAGHADEPAPNSAGKNVRALLWDAHERLITNKFMHTPHPQLRSVMRDIEENFAEQVRATSGSRFRATTDIAMGASFHHHRALMTGRAVPGEYKLRYVDVARPDAETRLDDLLATRRFDFFCLNESDTPADLRETVSSRVRTFLDSYFPFPSRWEKGRDAHTA